MSGRLATIIMLRAVALAGAIALPATVHAQSSLEDRVKRLETVLSSGALIELLQRVETLQGELQAMRGMLEEQSHTISQLKQRQRDLYLDIDRRIGKLETGGVVASTGGESGSSTDSGTETGDATQGTETIATAPPVPETTDGIDPIKEQDAYQTAFNLLKTGRYDEAGQAFRSFLDEYGGGKYADNAQYWLGETYYVRQQFEDAVREFRALTSSYPDSAKYPHALLKIGYSQTELGEKSAAKQTFAELVEKFPRSQAARNAEKRLQNMNSAGG